MSCSLKLRVVSARRNQLWTSGSINEDQSDWATVGLGCGGWNQGLFDIPELCFDLAHIQEVIVRVFSKVACESVLFARALTTQEGGVPGSQ